MTTAERDDYIVEHYGSTPRVQLAEAVAMTLPSLDTRVWQLRKGGRIPPKDRSKQLAAEPKHECPPHHFICGDNAILALWPDFYKTHERPAPGVEVQVCKHCGEIKAVEIYKPTSEDARIERGVAQVRESRAVAEAREREYAPAARSQNGNGHRIPIRELAAEIPDGHHFPSNMPARFPDHIGRDGSGTWLGEGVKVVLPVDYDGDSGDEHHDRPEQLHHVDIPEEQGTPLLEAQDDEDDSGVIRSCRVCGCTDEYGCDVGCEWVGPDLCSACVDVHAKAEGTPAGDVDHLHLLDVAEQTDTLLTPYGMALQELAKTRQQMTLLQSDLDRKEGELKGAYDQNKVLVGQLQQAQAQLQWTSKLLLYGSLTAKRDELQRELAVLGEEILKLGEEIKAGPPKAAAA